MDLPIVSVIIPHRDSRETLEAALDALALQELPKHLFEVIVVDNDSTFRLELPKNYPFRLTVIKDYGPGSYSARNAGAKIALAGLLAFTDADCIPDAKWLNNALAYSAMNPDIALFGGDIIMTRDGEPLVSAVAIYDALVLGLHQKLYVADCSFAITANAFVRKETFEGLGGFNARLKSSGDAEFGLRYTERGGKVGFCEDATVFHPPRYSLKLLQRRVIRLNGGFADRQLASGRTRLGLFLMRLRYWMPWTLLELRDRIAERRDHRILIAPAIGVYFRFVLVALYLHYSVQLEYLRIALGARSCRG